MRSTILGCGSYLPPRAVTSDELAGALATTGPQLTESTGVSTRREAEDGEGPSQLASRAAQQALAAAGLGPEAVDLIVFATMTPDIVFPGPGCFLQDQLGCRTVGAMDVRGQCAGFLVALATADRFIRAGKAECVLVAGAEVHSAALEYSPRAVAVTPYFGDGAGVVVLGASPEPGVLATVLHADPDGLERFWCEFPASRHLPSRMDIEAFRAGRHFYQLDAERMHPQAERVLPEVIGEALERAGVTREEVALFVLHYLDHRVARRAGRAAGIPDDRIVATAEAAGHMAAAGVPIALADALAAGRVRRGDVVCAAAFGGGMAWGAAVLRL
jgi:3-oxoacyl-[acyl-carrier-protein] synthase III